MSSSVPAAHRYRTFTGFFCPILCARSSACSIAAGTQCSSPNTTSLAAVSVIPWPHAWMDRTATRSSVSSWKRRTAMARSRLGVVPSMRTCGTRAARSAFVIASSMQRWCAKKSILFPEPLSRISATRAATSPAFARAVVTPHAVNALSVSKRPFSDPPFDRSDSTSARAASLAARAASAASSNRTHSRRLRGSWSATTDFSLRCMYVPVRTPCSSSRFEPPLASQPQGFMRASQYRFAKALNVPIAPGRSASSCVKRSRGRFSAGVPESSTHRLARFRIGTRALVRFALPSFT